MPFLTRLFVAVIAGVSSVSCTLDVYAVAVTLAYTGSPHSSTYCGTSGSIVSAHAFIANTDIATRNTAVMNRLTIATPSAPKLSSIFCLIAYLL